MYYQVTYEYNSHKYNSDIESNSVEDVKQIFEKLSTAHIVEIKEYVYFNKSYSKDDGKYQGKAKVTLFMEDEVKFIYIPKLKKGINITDLKQDLKSFYPTLERIAIKVT